MQDNRLLALTYFRGRVSLYAILKSLMIGKGDQVAMQAFTCIAVPEAVIATGAMPLYIDITRGSVTMDVKDLERKITSNTKAIIIQHTFGIPTEISNILRVALLKRIPIIEDCCHTLASEYKGQLLGTFGIASFYSFEWGKPLTAGIGGSAIINDVHLEEKIKLEYHNFTNPGFIKDAKISMQYMAYNYFYKPSVYWIVKSLFHAFGKIGFIEGNYNEVSDTNFADDFHMTMAKSVQKRLKRNLAALPEETMFRIKNGIIYDKEINSPMLGKVHVPDDSKVVYARYPLFAQHKNELIKKARKNKVEISDWYNTPVHPLEKMNWKSVCYQEGSCPVVEQSSEEIISLPTHQKTSEFELFRIIDFLNSFG